MELKCLGVRALSTLVDCSNRTFMELKFEQFHLFYIPFLRSNRTFMELKLYGRSRQHRLDMF